MIKIKRKILRLFLKSRYILIQANDLWYCYPISRKRAQELEAKGKSTFRASLHDVIKIEHNLHLGCNIIKEIKLCNGLRK